MADYKHCSVVNSDGYYVEFVLVVKTQVTNQDGTTSDDWVVQNYQIQEGEQLVDEKRPHGRAHAGDEGIVMYKWDGSQWVEGATAEEIAQWELENPAPISTPIDSETDVWDEMAAAISEGVNEV